MRKYDFKLAKTIIDKLSDLDVLSNASLGMHEDWFWTGQEVWNEEQGYLVNIDKITAIAGIDGSIWATPVLHVSFKDGENKVFNCYEGEMSVSILERIEAMNRASSGEISSKVQELRDELEILNFNTDE